MGGGGATVVAVAGRHLQIVVVVAGRRAAQIAVADGVGGAAGQRVGDDLPLEAKRLDLCASGMRGLCEVMCEVNGRRVRALG